MKASPKKCKLENGREVSRSQYCRLKKKAEQLGCRLCDVPDTRGKHSNHAKASSHYRWNDDMQASTGYKKIRVGKEHPYADPNGYAYEHLLIWVSAGNPPPKEDEVLHHKDEIKVNNRIGNLQLKKRTKHMLEHQKVQISDEDVRVIRLEYKDGLADTVRLSERYNIPVSTVCKYIRGEVRVAAGGPILNGGEKSIRKRRLK